MTVQCREEGIRERNMRKVWAPNEVQGTISPIFDCTLSDQTADVVLQAGSRWSQLVEGKTEEGPALLKSIMTGDTASQHEWGRIWEALVVLLNTPCPDEAEFSTLFDATDLRPKLFSNVACQGFRKRNLRLRFPEKN